MISKTHLLDHVTSPDCNGYLIRLFGDKNDDGRLTWIDFEVIGILWVEDDGKVAFQRDDAPSSPEPTHVPAEAEKAAHGFVKWDGCTQFEMAGVHVDCAQDLRALFAAVEKARELAGEAMGELWEG